MKFRRAAAAFASAARRVGITPHPPCSLAPALAGRRLGLPEPQEWLISQTRSQLRFLERSCTAFDQGFSDEAARIAVVLRVLFHSTKTQRSVLDQLGATGIVMLSTCAHYTPPTLEPGLKAAEFFWGLAPITMNAAGISLAAELQGSTIKDWLPFPEWWDQQVVFVVPPANTRLTRKLVVTNVADKQGAHVDPNLTPEYRSLALQPNMKFQFHRGTAIETGALKGADRVALRQIAFEVLSSPGILRYAS